MPIQYNNKKLTPHYVYSEGGKLKCSCCNKENKMRVTQTSDKEYSEEILKALVKTLPLRLVIKLLDICKEEIEEHNQVTVNINYADIG